MKQQASDKLIVICVGCHKQIKFSEGYPAGKPFQYICSECKDKASLQKVIYAKALRIMNHAPKNKAIS